jgi:hypothetical protein
VCALFGELVAIWLSKVVEFWMCLKFAYREEGQFGILKIFKQHKQYKENLI